MGILDAKYPRYDMYHLKQFIELSNVRDTLDMKALIYSTWPKYKSNLCLFSENVKLFKLFGSAEDLTQRLKNQTSGI